MHTYRCKNSRASLLTQPRYEKLSRFNPLSLDRLNGWPRRLFCRPPHNPDSTSPDFVDATMINNRSYENPNPRSLHAFERPLCNVKYRPLKEPLP